MNSNSISNISVGAFQGLASVTYMDFSDNLIPELFPFRNISLLSTLILDENIVTSIENNAFEGTNQLQKLSINTNKISVIDSFALKDLTKLRELKLSGNPLRNFSGLFLPDSINMTSL
ncbi:Protein slit [Trichoplax sp. H2]|nr:Protein slit [Trichoplax sp. H2]|eukprot:RDD45651.1 Protein slit [Trichoplax sp. H2]